MRVLMITKAFPPRFAGATVQALHLSRALMKMDVQVELVTDNFEKKTEELVYQGIPVFKKKSVYFGFVNPRWREFLYLLKVILLIMKKSYDVVFAHSVSGSDCLMFPVLNLLRQPNLLELTLVDNDDPLALKRRKLGSLYYAGVKHAQKIVAISSRLYELSREAGIPDEQLALIPVGGDTERFFPLSDEERSLKRRDMGLGAFHPIVLAVGQIEARKGYDYMMKAWKWIVARHPEALLLVAGPGNTGDNPFFVEIQGILGGDGPRTVRFLGVISNVNDYMQSADCLIHCAVSEGLPNTLVEAGLTGVPILCRNLPGVTGDILFDKTIGTVCDSVDPEHFAALFYGLLGKTEAQRFDSSKLTAERFDINNVASAYETLFRGLLMQKGKAERMPTVSLEKKRVHPKPDGCRQPRRQVKKIRVLHVIKTLNMGGAESNLYNLVIALNPADVECHVAYSSGGPYEAMLREKSIRLFKYESKERKVKNPVSVLIILKLILYILRHRIRVVHTHNYNAHVWGSIAAYICGVKVVEHVHDSRYESRAFLHERGLQETSQFNQAKYFSRLSNWIVVLTRSNRDYLIDNGIVPPGRVSVLLNGIPLRSNGSQGNNLREELGIPDGRKIIFTAMRLSPEKNAEMVIDIANLLRERNDVIFVVAGDGPQKTVLEQKAKDKNLNNKVVFVGFRPDIKELLSLSDIFILPTLRELHSVSMIEAMSMRVPVLVSEGVGCNDYFIESGVNGFLLNPRVAEEWASAIKLLLEDAQLCKRIGAAGRKVVEKECDILKIAGNFTNIYAGLCGLKV